MAKGLFQNSLKTGNTKRWGTQTTELEDSKSEELTSLNKLDSQQQQWELSIQIPDMAARISVTEGTQSPMGVDS